MELLLKVSYLLLVFYFFLPTITKRPPSDPNELNIFLNCVKILKNLIDLFFGRILNFELSNGLRFGIEQRNSILFLSNHLSTSSKV